MITNITLESFKCFRKVEVNPRRITAFVGPNGTGKSSVLQALALLKQSVDGSHITMLKTSGPLVNLGNSEQLRPKYSPYNNNRLLRFRFDGVYQRPPESFEDSGPQIENGKEVSKVSFSYQAELSDGKLTSAIQDSITTRLAIHALGDLRFVPAARGLVQPVYQLRSDLVEDISLSGGLSYQEQYTASNLAYTRPMENKISGLLKRVTGVGLRADMVPAQSVEVKALTPVGDVNIVGEGFGTNALISLFWQLVRAARDATVLIEEPEIHLHPKAQAELASVLVEEAQAEDKQIIMTTHSEHIVGRLLTLVAENKLTPDDVAIYAFEKDEKGECTARQLRVTEDGKVEGGVRDFFETDLAELDRYIRALQSRQ